MRTREHYLEELETIRAEVGAVGAMAQTALTHATDALFEGDVAYAQLVVAEDPKINHARLELENHIVNVIALQQPVASDLRLLVGALDIAGELERIADYAKGIAQVIVRGIDPAPSLLALLCEMAVEARTMLDNALDAVAEQQVDAALRLKEADDRVDAIDRRVRDEMVAFLGNRQPDAAQIPGLLAIAHYLERIADRATNIGEKVVYIATGELVELNP